MSMMEGISNWVDKALDVHSETTMDLVNGGMDVKNALKASKIMTKNAVEKRLDATFSNRNASEITTALSKESKTAIAV